MFISIHIPKTAGTALSIIFDYGSGRRILYDYNNLKEISLALGKSEKLYRQDVEEKDKHKEFIMNNFEFIHGHFWYEKYSNIFPDEKYITCVRDPIERLVSYYHHIVDGGDHVLESMATDWHFYKDLQCGKANLIDLAAHKYIGNLQSQYLQGRDIHDYDHVFVNEKLAESVYQFQLRFSFNRNDPFMNIGGAESIPKFNVKDARKSQRPEISKTILDKASSFLTEDYELYRYALEKFNAQGRAI